MKVSLHSNSHKDNKHSQHSKILAVSKGHQTASKDSPLHFLYFSFTNSMALLTGFSLKKNNTIQAVQKANTWFTLPGKSRPKCHHYEIRASKFDFNHSFHSLAWPWSNIKDFKDIFSFIYDDFKSVKSDFSWVFTGRAMIHHP